MFFKNVCPVLPDLSKNLGVVSGIATLVVQGSLILDLFNEFVVPISPKFLKLG